MPDGRRVRVIAVEIRGDTVRLGIEADFDIPIHRDEIWQRLDAAADGLPPPPDARVMRCAACNHVRHRCVCPAPP